MSKDTKIGPEETRALAVIDLAKGFIQSAILAQGPISPTANDVEVRAYYDRAANMAFSLAGLFRRKSIEIRESAKAMDEKANSDGN